MRRVMIISLVLLVFFLVGCPSGPDLKPAVEKTLKALELLEPDLQGLWASDQFLKDEKDREEMIQNRKNLFEETKKTLKVALDPEQKGKEEAKEGVR